MPDDDIRRQRLVDALQALAPLAQRLEVTARQQQQDAAALLDAAQRAVTLARGSEKEDR